MIAISILWLRFERYSTGPKWTTLRITWNFKAVLCFSVCQLICVNDILNKTASFEKFQGKLVILRDRHIKIFSTSWAVPYMKNKIPRTKIRFLQTALVTTLRSVHASSYHFLRLYALDRRGYFSHDELIHFNVFLDRDTPHLSISTKISTAEGTKTPTVPSS